MPAPISMRFVIDSSVMQASGAEHPVDERPGGCRKFLQAVRVRKHKVVVTDQILREWGRHMSRFGRKWLAQMKSRGLVIRLALAGDDTLKARVEGLQVRAKELALMLEDLFLIEAALATDRIVVSLDEEARRLFQAAADDVCELARIIWVNAGRAEEDVAGWVHKGVQLEPEQELGWKDPS